MTIPRRLSLTLADGRPQLRAAPIMGHGALVRELLGTTIDSRVLLDGLTEAARIELQARVPHDATLRITLRHDPATPQRGVSIAYTGSERRLEVDRTTASENVHAAFPSLESVIVPGDGELLTLTIVLDAGSIEVFAADGLRSITDLIYGVDDARGILLEARGAPVELIALRVTDLSGSAQ